MLYIHTFINKTRILLDKHLQNEYQMMTKHWNSLYSWPNSAVLLKTSQFMLLLSMIWLLKKLLKKAKIYGVLTGFGYTLIQSITLFNHFAEKEQGMSCEGACAHAHVRCGVAHMRVRGKWTLKHVCEVRAHGHFFNWWHPHMCDRTFTHSQLQYLK